MEIGPSGSSGIICGQCSARIILIQCRNTHKIQVWTFSPGAQQKEDTGCEHIIVQDLNFTKPNALMKLVNIVDLPTPSLGSNPSWIPFRESDLFNHDDDEVMEENAILDGNENILTDSSEDYMDPRVDEGTLLSYIPYLTPPDMDISGDMEIFTESALEDGMDYRPHAENGEEFNRRIRQLLGIKEYYKPVRYSNVNDDDSQQYRYHPISDAMFDSDEDDFNDDSFEDDVCNGGEENEEIDEDNDTFIRDDTHLSIMRGFPISEYENDVGEEDE